MDNKELIKAYQKWQKCFQLEPGVSDYEVEILLVSVFVSVFGQSVVALLSQDCPRLTKIKYKHKQGTFKLFFSRLKEQEICTVVFRRLSHC